MHEEDEGSEDKIQYAVIVIPKANILQKRDQWIVLNFSMSSQKQSRTLTNKLV